MNNMPGVRRYNTDSPLYIYQHYVQEGYWRFMNKDRVVELLNSVAPELKTDRQKRKLHKCLKEIHSCNGVR